MDPRPVLELVKSEWPGESSPPLLERLAATAVRRFVPEFLLEGEQDAAYQGLADVATALVAASVPGSSRAVIAARTIAECTGDERLLRRWLAGVDVPAGLDSDTDFRWLILGNLARRGLLDPTELDAAEEADPTFGWTARGPPSPGLPAESGGQGVGVEPGGRRAGGPVQPPARRAASGVLGGIRPRPREALRRPVLRGGPEPVRWLGDDALARVVRLGFPRVVERTTLALAEEALASATLSPATRRNLVDGASALSEAVVSRERYAPDRRRAVGGSSSGSW
jgi:aminopeptidase N